MAFCHFQKKIEDKYSKKLMNTATQIRPNKYGKKNNR